VFPDDHPLALGMPGMHGTVTATTSMQKADLLIALGARFDDRITGKVSSFAPDAKIVGDCRLVTEELIKAIRDLKESGVTAPDQSAWKSRISGWQEQFPLT